MSAGRAHNLVRVRWRYPWWNETTGTRSRIFVQQAYAERFAATQRDQGAVVEVAHSTLSVHFRVADVDDGFHP